MAGFEDKDAIGKSAIQNSRSIRGREFHSPLGTFHPNNLAVKNITLKTFKLLQNDPETATISSHNLHSPHTNGTKT